MESNVRVCAALRKIKQVEVEGARAPVSCWQCQCMSELEHDAQLSYWLLRSNG